MTTPDLRKALEIVRSTIGDLRGGFSRFVEPARWVEQMQAFIDEALSATPDSGWQPIETAPKDGTSILAWCRHPNHAYASDDEDRERWEGPVVAHWTDFNEGGWVWHGHVGKFLAWQPIPPPQTISPDKGEGSNG